MTGSADGAAGAVVPAGYELIPSRLYTKLAEAALAAVRAGVWPPVPVLADDERAFEGGWLADAAKTFRVDAFGGVGEGARFDGMGLLDAAGVSPALAAAYGIGAVEAVLDGGLWRPAAEGESAPLMITLPVGPLRGPVDVLALDPSEPRRWARMTGLGRWLGAGWLDPMASRGRPIRLYRAPLDWLRAAETPAGGPAHSAAGACLLERDPAALRPARMEGLTFVCDDARHAGALRAAVRAARRRDPLPAMPAIEVVA